MKSPLAITVIALAACGDLGAGVDASIDATMRDVSDAAYAFDDVSPIDVVVAPPAPDVGLVDGGGIFPCGNCTCDGRTHYCDDSQGPHAPIVDASAFDSCPSGWGACLPLPDACAPANCACLPNETQGASCSCFRSDSGDGLIAGCWYP